MAEQDGTEGRVLEGLGLLHAEVLQLFGELRALRAEAQELRGALHSVHGEAQQVRQLCGVLREGQRTLEAQSALQADALRLVAGVVQRLVEETASAPDEAT